MYKTQNKEQNYSITNFKYQLSYFKNVTIVIEKLIIQTRKKVPMKNNCSNATYRVIEELATCLDQLDEAVIDLIELEYAVQNA